MSQLLRPFSRHYGQLSLAAEQEFVRLFPQHVIRLLTMPLNHLNLPVDDVAHAQAFSSTTSASTL